MDASEAANDLGTYAPLLLPRGVTADLAVQKPRKKRLLLVTAII
jgi:hypothetical protein